MTCHAIGYVGGDLGPELRTIGNIRSKRDLLEAIAHPSASSVRSFESIIVTQNDGSALAGIIKNESNDEILLAVGPGTNIAISHNDVQGIERSPPLPNAARNELHL